MIWSTNRPRRALRRSHLVPVIFTMLLALVGTGLIVYGLVVPVTPEPPLLPEEPTAVQMTPSPSTTSSVVTPSSTPSSTPVAEGIRNPRGKPVKVTVTSAKHGLLIRSKVQAIRTRSDGRLVPSAGVAGWFADPGWPKPGVLSRYNSIVAGHVSGGGKPDVFYLLSKARKGDKVVIDYDSEDRVIIKVTNNPVNVGKDVVTSDSKYDWVWESKEGMERRIVSFFTCNAESEKVFSDGAWHSVDNWVVQGEVTEVIRA